uniref:Zinc finger, CCHC-type n=1 Tax=Tanacetum cinerariifolium TaxID=118510 RepID=A0A6L2NIF2_TANCI|nr:zinc finger, CCHC-type [Tanacetum cinerariifolium]
MLDHQDKYMMKAQIHVLKSSVIFDVQPLPRRKHCCQIYQVVKHILRGILLASFQDREHKGGDTRSQGGMKDNDLKIKIQDNSMHTIYQRISQEQGSKFQESHLSIEESLRAQDNDKPKGNNVVGPSVVNMVEYNNSSRYNDNKGKRKHHDTKADPNKKPKVTCWKCGKPGHLKRDCKVGNIGNKANGSGTKGSTDGSSNSLKAFMSTSKLNDSILWHARLGHVHFKRMQDMSKDGLISTFDMNTKKCKNFMLTKITKRPFQNAKRKTKVLELIHSDLCDLHVTPSLGNKKYFVIFIDDASRFIKPNDSVAINSIIESMDAIFDKHGFSLIPRPRQRSLVKRTEDSGGLVVLEKVTEEVVQQPEPELRKSKRHRTPKDFGPKFQLYLIEGTRDEVSDQHSYCFNVENDPKTFDEVMNSQDVAFWKKQLMMR